MCGIAGFTWEDRPLIKKMVDVIGYRGPDDQGFFIDKNVSLGHKRLSIIDTSAAGKQPLRNEDGSIYIIYNGEIYNYRELKKNLKNHTFTTQTDTEVIVHAYEEFGPSCVKKLNGMFAFALWDSGKKELFLARDRLGIKPLYYYHDGNRFLFASEIKSLLQWQEIKREMNLEVFLQILDFLFPLNNETLMKGIKEVPPGHTVTVSPKGIAVKGYWELEQKETAQNERIYQELLCKLLEESVKRRLVSDVPLGATLSGGLDSSLIVSLMSRVSENPVKTYTVGFGEESDEFEYARIVSEHCGTEHKELTIPYEKVTKLLPKIQWHMDTIITRTSTFPTYFYARELKKNVTVTLIGEGGDELFAGYPRYKPFSVRNMKNVSVDKAIKKVPLSFFKPSLKKKLYSHSTSVSSEKNRKTLEENFANVTKDTMLNRALSFEVRKQLPGVHLLRIDRMTMAHSLEARVPYLDHTVVEYAASIPSKYKIYGNDEKYILKKTATTLLPKRIITREKVGLRTPVPEWFRDDFYELIPHFISPEIIEKRGWFREAPITGLMKRRGVLMKVPAVVNKLSKRFASKRVQEFLQDAYATKLWFLVMIELWYRMFIESDVRNPSFSLDKYL